MNFIQRLRIGVFFSQFTEMGNHIGGGSSGMMISMDLFLSACPLLLCPVISVWDFIVRRMGYSFIPEWA